MSSLLYIEASPRGEKSRSSSLAHVFLEECARSYPQLHIETRNLWNTPLPPVTGAAVSAKYALMNEHPLADSEKKAWNDILQHVQHFKAADGYLISVPMWNFNVPYPLKHYIDVIVQPGHTFHYTENGPEGLVKEKPLCIITTRGGDYSKNSPFYSYDMQTPWLKNIFSFIGFTNITFVHAQPMDAGSPETIRDAYDEACTAARAAASSFFTHE